MNPTKVEVAFGPFPQEDDFRARCAEIEQAIIAWCREMTLSEAVFAYVPDQQRRTLKALATFYDRPDAVFFKTAWTARDI